MAWTLKHILLTLFIVLFQLHVNAVGKEQQKASVPSIDFDHLNLSKPSPAKIDSAYLFLKSNPIKALGFIEELLSNQNTSAINKSECYYILCLININLSNYDEALKNNLSAIDLVESNSKMTYLISKPIGYIYELKNSNDDAMHAYNNYYDKALARLDTTGIIYSNSGKARILQSQSKFKRARKMHKSVLDLQKQSQDQNGYASTSNNLGEIALNENKSKEAIQHFKKAKKLSTSNSSKYRLYNSEIRSIIKEENNVEELINFQKQEVVISQESNDTVGLLEENLELSNIYIDNQQWDNAIQSIQGNISLSKQVKDYEQLSEGYRNLSKVYKETGKTEEALKTLDQYSQTIDSLYEHKQKLVAEKIAFHKTIDEKQQHIANLRKDAKLNKEKIKVFAKNEELQRETIRQQNIINYALASILGILLITSFIIFRSSKKRKIANQLLALKSLRTQMNPHFIFNALNSVNGFIAANDERQANKYLADFSKLMRAVLENSKSDLVPLESELSIIKLYLQLEHFRFKEKFDYSFEISPDIAIDEIDIPPMFIQPYIENSVWHGLRYKKNKGFLKVNCFKEANTIHFIIEDNGIGRKNSQQFKTQNQKTEQSTGLKNITERLAIINNLNNTNIQVEINDLDSSKDDCGTQVRIKIPIYE